MPVDYIVLELKTKLQTKTNHLKNPNGHKGGLDKVYKGYKSRQEVHHGGQRYVEFFLEIF